MVLKMEPQYSFGVQTNLRVGVGSSNEISGIVRDWGFRRLGLVLDNGVASNYVIEAIRKRLNQEFLVQRVLENSVVEPDYDYLDTAAEKFRGVELDCLVAFGGGSTLDLAKGISVLLTNPGPGINYRGFDLVREEGIPLIAVPTTAGTGSEVTPNAIFTDKKEMKKFGINTSRYLPKLAVLDPLLVTTCPRSVTVSSGMDALTHAIESYVARSSTPISRLFSAKAFHLVFDSLPKILDEPDDIELRMASQLGAFYAGIALPNSGPGPAGAMSYPLGVHHKVPHGLAGAVFLESVARLNVERGCFAYAGLYDHIEGAETNLDDEGKSRSFCDRLRELCDVVQLPKSLDVFGVDGNDISSLAEQTFALQGAIEQNPVAIDYNDIYDFFASRM